MRVKPLDGVVVVAVEQAVAAPFATRQLADLGARVIKIERPGSGDFARAYDETVEGMSSAFVWLNRGKESVALDFHDDDGRVVLESLIERSDVFVNNLSPAASRRAGLDTSSIQSRHPHVIACSISGYGQSGPLANAKAYDLLVQGETGMISLTGSGDQMAKVGISIADISAGTYAYSSILAALLHRDRTGVALPVDVSLFDSLTEWLGYPLYYTMHGGCAPDRRGTDHSTIAPYGAFATEDGGRVLIAVQNGREWFRFCDQVLGDASMAALSRFASHQSRVAHRGELDDVISAHFGSVTLETALDQLRLADIATARLNGIADLAHHEQLTERRRWIDTGIPGGTIQTLLPPWVPGDASSRPDLGDVPELGEHTSTVLEWLDSDDSTRSRSGLETAKERKAR